MLNKIEYQGRFTADPELKKTQSDVPVMEFTMAWSEKYKEADTTCFLRCKAWRYTAEHIAKWFHKGDQAIVEGHMETESWEKDGQKQSRTLCVVEKIHFCGPGVGKKTVDDSVARFMQMQDTDDEELPFN